MLRQCFWCQMTLGNNGYERKAEKAGLEEGGQLQCSQPQLAWCVAHQSTYYVGLKWPGLHTALLDQSSHESDTRNRVTSSMSPSAAETDHDKAGTWSHVSIVSLQLGGKSFPGGGPGGTSHCPLKSTLCVAWIHFSI